MRIAKLNAIAAALVFSGTMLAGFSAQAQPDHRPPPPAGYGPGYHRHDGPPPMAVGRPLPREYRGGHYRVRNWRHYRLPPPGYGQYWVQYGPQYLLIGPTGLVVQVF